MAKHARFDDANGTAALGICESLLIALTELKLITDLDARNLLTDVSTSHQDAITTSKTPDKHQAVVAVLQRILAGKNGVRA